MRQRGFIALPAFTPLGWVLVGMGVLCLGLTIWGLWERSGKLSCEVDRVALQAQVAVLSDAVKRQNEGVDAVKAAGDQIAKDTARTLAAIRAEGRKREPELAEIAAILKNPTPAGADCNRAWSEIEKRGRP